MGTERKEVRRLPWDISGIIIAALALAGCTKAYQESVVTKTPLVSPDPTVELPTPTPIPPQTVIEAMGDVGLGRYVNVSSSRHMDYFWPFLLIEGKLPEADIMIGNLESPVHYNCPVVATGMKFCMPPEAVSSLSRFGFKVMNIANNHALDYGQEGYEETIKALKGAGIEASDEGRLIVIEKDGVRFGFIGFNRIKQGRGYEILSDEETFDRIKKSKSEVDTLIVSFHWGEEYSLRQDEEQIRLGRGAIDMGADVVIGTHPHVVQPIEEYNGGLIFYSLGNFVFDQQQNEAVRKGFVAEIVFMGEERVSYETIPIRIENWGQPRLTNP